MVKIKSALRIFLMLFLFTGIFEVAVPQVSFAQDGSASVQTSSDKKADRKQRRNERTKQKVSKKCEPISTRIAAIQTCLLCPLFEVILKTDQNVATKSFSALAPGFTNLVVMALALFIAFQTLITVSAFTKQETSKYLAGIAVQAFKAVFAVILLSNSTYIYHYVINPLMEAGLEFGLALADADLVKDLKSSSDMPKGVISDDLLSKVLCTVRLFSKSAAELPAIGSSLICVARHTAYFPDIYMLIEGIVCWLFGWAIALACCFYLLDSVVRFGIFCMLLPFFIAAWPFKVTFTYTKKGWEIFINAFFNFVMMGLIITLTSELISQSLTGGEGGKEEIYNALNENNIELLKDLMDLSGSKFLVLMACCIFAFKLVGQVNALASEISGASGGTPIGGKIGGLAAQGAKRIGKTALNVGATATGLKGAMAGVKGRFNKMNDSIHARIAGGGKPKSGGGSGGGNNNSGGGNNNSGGGGNNNGSNP